MYTLMCFNVFAHNRDDHSKNFSFLCIDGRWQLAPAYDLTFSNSMGGEHATTVAGEGRSPSVRDILSVGRNAGISQSAAKQTADRVRQTVEQRLAKYLDREA